MTLGRKGLLLILTRVFAWRRLWAQGCRRAQRPETEPSHRAGPLMGFVISTKLPEGSNAKVLLEVVGLACKLRRATRWPYKLNRIRRIHTEGEMRKINFEINLRLKFKIHK